MPLPNSDGSKGARRAFVEGLADMDYEKCLPFLSGARQKGRLELSEVIDEAQPKLVAEALNALGSHLRRSSHGDEAELLYEAALNAGVDVRLNLANLLAENPDQRSRAKSLYEDVWASGDLDALNNLAQLLTNEGDPQAAESTYLEAIRHGDSLAWRNYALFLLEENRVRDAERQLRELARANPGVGVRPMADLLALLGRWEEAAELYRQADSQGADLPRAVRRTVRSVGSMRSETLRRSLRQGGSRVFEALEYGRSRRPELAVI